MVTTAAISAPTAAPPSSGAETTAFERLATRGPGKQVFPFPDDGLEFSSRFDGGNLQRVQKAGESGAFDLEVAEDAAGFGFSTGYTTWFYFEVSRVRPCTAEVQLTLTNLNAQRGLYANGYTVLYCSVDGATKFGDARFDAEQQWKRLADPVAYEVHSGATPLTGVRASKPASDMTSNQHQPTKQGNRTLSDDANVDDTRRPPLHELEKRMRLSFSYRFRLDRERVRFAFSYPYTYSKVQRQLAALDVRFPRSSIPTAVTFDDNQVQASDSDAVYFHRELLTRSLEGLRVDLLTISSFDGISLEREPPLCFQTKVDESKSRRALQFDLSKKKLVVISARVHPAESPANFVLDGMLRLLLHPTDEDARLLRRHFIFKIIPMLNPDGVCQGYYRTDTRGVNLNRVYEAPNADHAPTVFAMRELLLHYVGRYGGPRSVQAQRNVVYLDLHAHSNRRGCFIFGNNFINCESSGTVVAESIARQVETQLFARLVGLNSPFFDYVACSFDKEDMVRRDLRDNNNATTSRQGSSRVALFLATGLTYVYTIECNYNEGRRNLRASAPMSLPPAGSAAAPSQSACDDHSAIPHLGTTQLERPTTSLKGKRLSLYTKYSPDEWKDVGIGSLTALLDLFGVPDRSSQVQFSAFKSMERVRASLHSEIKAASTAAVTAIKGQETERRPQDALVRAIGKL